MIEHYSAKRIDDFWIPGMSLDAHYPAATPEQLEELFTRHLGTDALSLCGVLSAVRRPDDGEKIRAIASIDLCEVVRSTAGCMSTTHGREYLGNDYRQALWRDERFNNLDGEENPHLTNTIQPIAQVMINNGHVKPVDEIDEIAEMTASWRRDLGVYCVANTSTASGCEIATVSFMNKHLPDSFDGIVFPRNPMGRRDRLTKSVALKHVINSLTERDHDIEFALHIDDSQGHHLSMIEEPPHPSTHVFVPEHPEYTPVDLGSAANVTRSASAVESFRRMDDYIRQRF